MPKNDDIIRSNSILIVSANEQFTAIVKRSLNGFITIDVKKSIAAARRSVLEKSYDIVVVNTPLSDETGEDFAMDISERFNSSILLVTPEGIYDEVLETHDRPSATGSPASAGTGPRRSGTGTVHCKPVFS